MIFLNPQAYFSPSLHFGAFFRKRDFIHYVILLRLLYFYPADIFTQSASAIHFC